MADLRQRPSDSVEGDTVYAVREGWIWDGPKPNSQGHVGVIMYPIVVSKRTAKQILIPNDRGAMGRTTWTLPDFDAYFSLTASEALERFITQKRVDIARIRKSLIEPEALEAEAITMLAQMPAV